MNFWSIRPHFLAGSSHVYSSFLASKFYFTLGHLLWRWLVCCFWLKFYKANRPYYWFKFWMCVFKTKLKTICRDLRPNSVIIRTSLLISDRANSTLGGITSCSFYRTFIVVLLISFFSFSFYCLFYHCCLQCLYIQIKKTKLIFSNRGTMVWFCTDGHKYWKSIVCWRISHCHRVYYFWWYWSYIQHTDWR